MAKYFENDSRSMRDRMQAGDLYIADDPQLEADSLRAASLSDQYNRLSPQDPDAAAPLLAELLGGIGEQSVIRAPLFVDYGKYLTVGARTFINFNLTALDVAAITIGDDVQIGPNVQLLTPTHPLEAEARRDKLEAAKPITIGNNVWLGGGVIVLPGVNIGENTVVGAGSVVTRDLPANVVAVGNPARVIRELP
ncbi:sugar O-acetyltransferase [Arthrobacter koreensis]